MYTKLKATLFISILSLGLAVLADEKTSPISVENLMKTDSETADNIEVIVSIVELEAGATLPKHYHPGEEYVYALEGSATVMLDGEPDIQMKPGDIMKIPYEQIHSAVANEPSKVLVFRIHQKGEPERIPVE